MKVVILCGGRGTRLREETEFKPKPMVEIGDNPILWHIMKIYSHYGFDDFILCLGYKGELIRQFIANYEAMHYDSTFYLGTNRKPTLYNKNSTEKWKVTLVNTGLDSNTGMRIKAIKRFVENKPFMLTYGDGLSDINLRKLLKFHNSNRKTVTISGVYPIERFGVMEVDPKGNVNRFLEKPKMGNLINAGFMVCQPHVFNYIEDNVIFEKEPLGMLAKEKQLACFKHSGFWHCMDTFRDFIYLNEMWNWNNAPWKVWKD